MVILLISKCDPKYLPVCKKKKQGYELSNVVSPPLVETSRRLGLK
jgi:hypothetical protein